MFLSIILRYLCTLGTVAPCNYITAARNGKNAENEKEVFRAFRQQGTRLFEIAIAEFVTCSENTVITFQSVINL